MTERLRYFPGLRAFVGFKQVLLMAERGERYDRFSRVKFWGLLRLAAQAFFLQSRLPATLFYLLSAVSLTIAVGLIAYAVVAKLLGIAVVSWARTLSAVSFFSSIVILGQAFICEYLSRIYEETRHRPIYIVEKLLRGPILSEVEHGASYR